MELNEAISYIIRRERKKSGLSQEKLAYASDLDRTYISFLERGERNPTIITLFKICGALNIKPSDFIQEVENTIENYSNKNSS